MERVENEIARYWIHYFLVDYMTEGGWVRVVSIRHTMLPSRGLICGDDLSPLCMMTGCFYILTGHKKNDRSVLHFPRILCCAGGLHLCTIVPSARIPTSGSSFSSNPSHVNVHEPPYYPANSTRIRGRKICGWQVLQQQ